MTSIQSYRDEAIRDRERAETLAKEEMKDKIDRAAAIVTMLDSDGGRELVTLIKDLRKTVTYEPIAFFCERQGANGTTVVEVNASMVARTAGFIEGLDAIVSLLDAQRVLIEKESAKNSV